jgi:hypothetical protein
LVGADPTEHEAGADSAAGEMTMTNEVATVQSFQERVGSMIRSQIGELMTNEEIKALVDKAMHEAFFEKRVVKVGQWGDTKTEPPYAIELVTDLLREEVKTAAVAWLKENPEAVQEAIKDAIGKGMMDMLTTALNGYFWNAFEGFRNELRNKGIAI